MCDISGHGGEVVSGVGVGVDIVVIFLATLDWYPELELRGNKSLDAEAASIGGGDVICLDRISLQHVASLAAVEEVAFCRKLGIFRNTE